MPRKSLRPELNRIRGWVRQGRTDAWIAHQLEVTVQQIQTFKKEQALEAGAETDSTEVSIEFDEEVDLRAEDDALIAAQLDAEAEARTAAEAEAAAQAAADAAAKAAAGEDETEAEDEDDEKPKRRRGRRGGRSTRRKKPVGPLEATFDHGEEGYGLWLDPSVQDDPVYAEYWAGHRPVEVVIEEDQIIIRRVSSDSEPDTEAGAEPKTAADVEPGTDAQADDGEPATPAAGDEPETTTEPDAEAIAAALDAEDLTDED